MRRANHAALWAAYAILIGVFAFGAYWVQDTFAQAQRDRCEVANLEFGLAVLEVLSLPQEERDFQGEALDVLLEDAAAVTVDICEGTGIEPSSITQGEDTSV